MRLAWIASGLMLLIGISGCGSAMEPTKLVMRVHILMPFEEFVEQNRDAIADQLPRIDKDSWYRVVETRRTMAIELTDKKGRLPLRFDAAGTWANPIRIQFSNSDTAAVGNVCASQFLEFALADGQSLKQRLIQASEIQAKLTAAGFRPDVKIQNHWKVTYGNLSFTDYRQLLDHLDVVTVENSLELFTMHQDELVLAVVLMKQAATTRVDDYTLYFVIRQIPTGARDLYD